MTLRNNKKGRVILNNLRASSQYPDAITFNIARKEVSNMEQLICLAPSWELVLFLKTNLKEESVDDAVTWEAYKKGYKLELDLADLKNKTVNKVLWSISYFLELGYDVQFVCFCSDPKYCHRSIIGEIFENRGYEVIGKAKEERR